MPEATRLQAFCCMWGSDGSAAGGRESDLSEWPRSADEEGFSKPTKLPGTAIGHKGSNLNTFPTVRKSPLPGRGCQRS